MKLTVKVDPTKIARGHEFMKMLRRGGKFNKRKSRRTEKQKMFKD